MTNALAIRNYSELEKMAESMTKSGMFKDVTQVNQAIVKIVAGNELGIGPFTSMSGIHIVQGKPTLSSNLIATLVKNDPRYNYKPKVTNDKECVLEWYEDGEVVGQSSFTMDEASRATTYDSRSKKWKPLSSKNTWQSYPSDMLFARALTRGARRFAPGIFGGAPVYTPEELGAEVDEDGDVITGGFVEVDEVVRPEEVRLTARDDYEQHISYADAGEVAAELGGEVSKQYVEYAETDDRVSLIAQYESAGGHLYGPDWETTEGAKMAAFAFNNFVTNGGAWENDIDKVSTENLSDEQLAKSIEKMAKKISEGEG